MLEASLLPLVGFVIAAGVLTITPGVDTALVLRSVATGGARAGISAAIGVCAGLLVWGVCAGFGLTALLSASQVAFTVVKWAGAAYLVSLGVRLILKPRTALEDLSVGGSTQGAGSIQALRRGFLTNVLNPKVGVFYVTFLPQFIPDGANVTAFSIVLAAVHVLLTLLWFSVLIGLTIPLGTFLAQPVVVKTLDRLTGCVFVGFGAKLAFAPRA